jgi:hypothetical protein
LTSPTAALLEALLLAGCTRANPAFRGPGDAAVAGEGGGEAPAAGEPDAAADTAPADDASPGAPPTAPRTRPDALSFRTVRAAGRTR